MELVPRHPDLPSTLLVDKLPAVVDVVDRDLGLVRPRDHHHLVAGLQAVAARASVVVGVDHLGDTPDTVVHLGEKELLASHHVLGELHKSPARIFGRSAELLPPGEGTLVTGEAAEVVLDRRNLVAREVVLFAAEHGPPETDWHRERPLRTEEQALVAVAGLVRPVVGARLEHAHHPGYGPPVEVDLERDPLLEIPRQAIDQLQLLVAPDEGEAVGHDDEGVVDRCVADAGLDAADQLDDPGGVVLRDLLDDLAEGLPPEHAPALLVHEEGELELLLLEAGLEQDVVDEGARSTELDGPAEDSGRLRLLAIVVHRSELVLDLIISHSLVLLRRLLVPP